MPVPESSPADPAEERVRLFLTMVLIRAFDQAIRRVRDTAGLWPDDPTMVSAHGHEAVAAGLCAQLERSDSLVAAQLPAHLAVAHGMELTTLAVRALSHEHPVRPDRLRLRLFDPDTHFFSAARASDGLPVALGRAFAFQQRATGRVAVVLLGRKEASREGFQEALNLALLWALPLVFVIENDSASVEPLSAYGVQADPVDGDSVELVAAAAGKAITHARLGRGAAVLDIRITAGPGADPVASYEARLLEQGVLDQAAASELHEQARTLVATAITKAVSDPRLARRVQEIRTTEQTDPSEAQERWVDSPP